MQKKTIKYKEGSVFDKVQKAQKGKPVKKTPASKTKKQGDRLITTSKYNTVEDLPTYRRRFYENLNPYNYDTTIDGNAIERGINTIILNKKESLKEEHDKKLNEFLKKGEKRNRVRRDDAQRMAVGLPQRSGTFKEPTYEPSKKDNSILQTLGITSKTPTYEFTDPGMLEYLKAYSNYPELFDEKGMLIDEDNVAGVMGNFKISKGKDEKGEYLSYYDRYNFEPLKNMGIPITLPIADEFDTYGRYYLNDKSVKNNPKYRKYIEGQKKELEQKRDKRNKNYRVNNYNTSLGTPGIRQYGGTPQAQFGDLLSSGPLADLLKSGEDWNRAWRGNIFDKSGLLNKTIYQNQKGLTSEKMYGDPNSPFYDPNYKTNVQTARDAAQSDYDSQLAMYEEAKLKAQTEGTPFDEREWTHIAYGPETYIDTVTGGDANIAGYKPKSDAQKLQQTAQGVFSGLQYQAGYEKPEPVKLEQGFQGTQWAQYGYMTPNNKAMNINLMNQYLYGGRLPHAQVGQEVSTTYSKPEDIISKFKSRGLLSNYTEEDILAMSPQEQDELFKAEAIKFRETDPRSPLKKTLSGEIISETVTPLTTTVQEVIPGTTTTTMSEEDRFNEWYKNQPEGTVQEFEGRKIKIDRSGKGSTRKTKATTETTTTPDRVVTTSGLARDILNQKYGGNAYYYQDGGPVNYTGYTPGSPTSNNPMNIIPGQNVTMNPPMGGPVSEPLLAIASFGKKKDSKGTNHGLIKNLEPGDEWNVPGASRIVEIKKNYKEESAPTSKYGSSVNRKPIRFGGNINDILQRTSIPNFQYSGEALASFYQGINDMKSEPASIYSRVMNNPVMDLDSEAARNYLVELAGNEQLGPMNSSPEFNRRMIEGRNAEIQRANAADLQRANRMLSQAPPPIDQNEFAQIARELEANSGPIVNLPTDPMQVTPAFMDGQETNKLSPKGITDIYNLRGDKSYEYAKDKNGRWLTRKKGTNTDWTILDKSGLDKSVLNEAISKLNKSATKVGGKNIDRVTNIDWSNNSISTSAVQRNKGAKKYQYGGEINNDHTFPVHPITEEFTEIQTEKGETIFLPDGTIVEVKADKLHKNMDKDRVTDILPEGAYIFSRDPFMKIGSDTKIGGIKLSDMKVGKTVFEYKENEITSGPQDIMISDVFKLKANSTPADISRSIKKKFEVRDMKNDFFVQRANDENKKQRVEYLEILKTFSEYKKPKSKRSVPKAQYGMNTSMNMGLDNMFNRQANQALDNVMGYSNKALDPYSNVDNNIKSRYNISSSTSTMSFENGGSVPHAGIGDLVKLSPMYWLGDYFVGQKAERQNRKLAQENEAAWRQKGEDLKKTGALNIGTNLATMASSMNVPDTLYNDYGTEFATTQEAYNRANLLNQANKYAASQSLGSPASLARFSGSNQNLGSYLAQANTGNAGLLSDIAVREGQLGIDQAAALNQYRSMGTEGYNQAINNRRLSLQAATTAGLGNVGRSATDYVSSRGDYNFDKAMNKMSFDRYLEQRKQEARDRYSNTVTGIAGGVAELGTMFLPGGALAGTGLGKSIAGKLGGAGTTGISNAAQSTSSPLNQFLSRTNSIVPGGTVNRDNFYLNPFSQYFRR